MFAPCVFLVFYYFNCQFVPNTESDWTKYLLLLYFKNFQTLWLEKSFWGHIIFCCKCNYCVFLSIWLSAQFFLHFMIWGSNCCWFIQNKPFWQQILSSYKYESRGDFLLSFFTFELRACLKTHRDSCNTKFP